MRTEDAALHASSADVRSAGVPGVAVLTVAVSLGIAAGLLEVVVLAARKLVLDKYLHLNPQVVWLAPLCYALLFGLAAGAVLLVLRTRPLALALVAFGAAASGLSGALFLAAPTVHKGALMVLAAGASVQLARVVRSHPLQTGRLARRALPWLAGTVALLAVVPNATRAVIERGAERTLSAAAAGAPNILLIIWDTVRAASLGVYGYERPTTPVLERLATDGVVFEHALSTAPWTLPSHASIFTGLPAHMLAADWRTPLEREPVTLAAVLRRHGYRTGGFVANLFYCSTESGLSRGFASYRDYPVFSFVELLRSASIVRAAAAADAGVITRLLGRLRPVAPANAARTRAADGADSAASARPARPGRTATLRQRLRLLQDAGRKDGRVINEQFLAWVGAAPDRPFFAFLNYFDAHAPYLPPAPFDTAFGPLLPGRNPITWTASALSRRELQAEIDAYDGTIAYLDHRLGELLARLDAMGLLDNTIVVVTSDHGEEFGEHGVFTHGNSLYQEAVHVPLIVRAPGRLPGGARVNEWASISDIGATVLDLARIGEPRFPGRSLTAAALRAAAADAYTDTPHDGAGNGAPTGHGAALDTLFARVSFSWAKPDHYPVSKGDMEAVFAAPWKYIVRGDGREELYDLLTDPREQRDLTAAAGSDTLLVRLRGTLRRALESGAPREGRTPPAVR